MLTLRQEFRGKALKGTSIELFTTNKTVQRRMYWLVLSLLALRNGNVSWS